MTISVKAIELTRIEGPIGECDNLYEFATYEQANNMLRAWSDSAPKTGGYDKCDFKITFEDFETYEGRYDLRHWSCGQDEGTGINLRQRIRDHLLFIVGKRRPGWMTDEEWESTKQYNQPYVRGATDYLENYDV